MGFPVEDGALRGFMGFPFSQLGMAEVQRPHLSVVIEGGRLRTVDCKCGEVWEVDHERLTAEYLRRVRLIETNPQPYIYRYGQEPPPSFDILAPPGWLDFLTSEL